jgi:hypothetical protein
MSDTKTPEPAPITPADPAVKKWSDWINPWQTLIGVVLGLVTGVGGTWLNIRSAARDAVTEEKFLAELAARVRPTCIFDGNGAILSDLGASEMIESIAVKHVPQDYGFSITIKFKRRLVNEPIVTGLSVNLFPEQVTRGSDNLWTFALTPASTLPALLTDGGPPARPDAKFKLEILQ